MLRRYKPASIVRSIMVATNTGSSMFSDRLRATDTKPEGRSIKVWGWKRIHYETAALALKKQGYDVEMVTSPTVNTLFGPSGGQIRLHVR